MLGNNMKKRMEPLVHEIPKMSSKILSRTFPYKHANTRKLKIEDCGRFWLKVETVNIPCN